MLLLYVVTAPAKVVSVTDTIDCGRDCTECEKMTVEPLLSLEES